MNGTGTTPLGGLGGNQMQGMNAQEQAMVKMVSVDSSWENLASNRSTGQMQAGMESCPIKTVIAGTMGFGLGGAFGLFMASVGYTFHISFAPAESNTSQ